MRIVSLRWGRLRREGEEDKEWDRERRVEKKKGTGQGK